MQKLQNPIRPSLPFSEVGRLDRYFCTTHAKQGALQVKARHDGNNLWSPITIRDAVMTNDNQEIHGSCFSSFFGRRKNHPETEMHGFLSKRSQRDAGTPSSLWWGRVLPMGLRGALSACMVRSLTPRVEVEGLSSTVGGTGPGLDRVRPSTPGCCWW